jgi:DNA-binding GntR family transcriptional regulator
MRHPRNIKPATADPVVQTSAERIAFSVLRAIAGGRLVPGTRLTEERLAAVFGVSRTVVRQALTQLSANGVVGVRPKKGWFITEPPEDEVRDLFAARRLLEGALIGEFALAATPAQTRLLHEHLQQQEAALGRGDTALRTHLLSDFHIRIAELTGNAAVTRMVRDLTTRTNLISMLYQTSLEASTSCVEHADLLDAIKRHDGKAAARLMQEHLLSIEHGLRNRRVADPVGKLRDALSMDNDAGAVAPQARDSAAKPTRATRGSHPNTPPKTRGARVRT